MLLEVKKGFSWGWGVDEVLRGLLGNSSWVQLTWMCSAVHSAVQRFVCVLNVDTKPLT